MPPPQEPALDHIDDVREDVGSDPPPLVVYTYDLDGTCTLSQGPGLQGFGLRPSQLVGENLFALYRDDPISTRLLRRALAGESYSVRTRVAGRVLHSHHQPLRDLHGRVVGGMGVLTDVTEQIALERTAAQASTRLAVLVRLSAALAHGVTDPDDLLTSTVRAAAEGLEAGSAVWVLGDDGRLTLRDWHVALQDDRPPAPPRPEMLRQRLSIDRAAVSRIDRMQRIDLTTGAAAAYGNELIEHRVRVTGAHTLLRVPLRGRGELIGVLDVVRYNDAPDFDPDEEAFVSDVAERCALALDNALLLRSQRAALAEQAAAEAALRDLAEQRRSLLDRLVEAEETERARIAADVHDDSVQVLAAVELRLGLLLRRIRERAPELVENVDPLRETVSEATDRLRALLFDLTPHDLDHGVAPALRELARDLFEGSGTRVQVEGHDEPDLPLATRRVAFRIAREALFNVRKHAQAGAVEVHLSARDGGLEIVVTDDGVGIADDVTSPAGHLGLTSMQDRAHSTGGRWGVRRLERGTEVRAWLPAQPPQPTPSV